MQCKWEYSRFPKCLYTTVSGNPCNIVPPCAAGTTAPPVKNLSNICPATTVNLNDAHTGTTPTGASLVWYNNNAHTGTPLSGAQITAAGAGTYYAFYTGGTSCWSPASNAVTVTIANCPPPAVNISLCGGAPCANSDYTNFGLYSNDNAASIEFDNFVSAFHSTAVRNGDGTFKIWGETTAVNGSGHIYSPVTLDGTFSPLLAGKEVMKVTIGSWSKNYGTAFVTRNYGSQNILLADDGLYAWGLTGRVLSSSVKNTSAFSKLTIGGKADGLPAGVSPSDVKSLTATYRSLALLTCNGDAYMLTIRSSNAGIGSSSASSSQWHRVTKTDGSPLTDIIQLRVQYDAVFALDSNGDLWTWGAMTYLGNGTARANKTRATKMALPKAGTIKMIGLTFRSNYQRTGTTPYEEDVISPSGISYYVLYTDGSLYSLGYNYYRQLGNLTTTDATSWVQAKYADGTPMNDIHWISPNEHDSWTPAINVITKTGTVYNWGMNDGKMLGRPTDGTAYDAGIPGGLQADDRIAIVVTGGHTTMLIKENEPKMGYVGHFINGSPGNGDTGDSNIDTFQYIDVVLNICGTIAPVVEDVTSCPPFNLNDAVQTNDAAPSTYEVRWFDGPDLLTANPISDPTNIATAGTYYAAYFDTATSTYVSSAVPAVFTADCTDPCNAGTDQVQLSGSTLTN